MCRSSYKQGQHIALDWCHTRKKKSDATSPTLTTTTTKYKVHKPHRGHNFFICLFLSHKQPSGSQVTQYIYASVHTFHWVCLEMYLGIYIIMPPRLRGRKEQSFFWRCDLDGFYLPCTFFPSCLARVAVGDFGCLLYLWYQAYTISFTWELISLDNKKCTQLSC